MYTSIAFDSTGCIIFLQTQPTQNRLHKKNFEAISEKPVTHTATLKIILLSFVNLPFAEDKNRYDPETYTVQSLTAETSSKIFKSHKNKWQSLGRNMCAHAFATDLSFSNQFKVIFYPL